MNETFVLGDMRRAASDLSWLLSRGYALRSALKLVGDRYDLAARPREAVRRATSPEDARRDRLDKEVDSKALARGAINLDGFNILAIVRSAQRGEPVFVGLDGAVRDLAGLAGRFRIDDTLRRAIEAVSRRLKHHDVQSAHWYLDAPVSNSGRIRQVIETITEQVGLVGRVEVVPDPDKTLIASKLICASSDSAVLDGCAGWFNLASDVLSHEVNAATIFDVRMP